MFQGCETPLHAKSSLLKLAQALQNIDLAHTPTAPVKTLTKYGKEEVLSFFEMDFLKATTWFSYYEEFAKLNIEERVRFLLFFKVTEILFYFLIQLELMQAIWHVFARLYKLSTAAMGKRRQMCEEQMLMISHDTEYTAMDLTKIEFDYSWCTKYSNEQMQQ